jgi:signal transduction histidine kinase
MTRRDSPDAERDPPLARDRGARAKQDIGALEQHAARLREANEHLVLATIEAQTLRDAAARTIRRQEQFLATLAHELRNPLAPIRTANAVLGLAATGEPRLLKIHEIIERQVRQMARLLDDLLDAARMTSGKLELQKGPVAIRQFLEQAIEASKPLIDERQQSLSLDIPARPVLVHGDAARLTQVFSNLLHNASKYTQVGGAITLTVRVEGDAVVLRLADNGSGIAAESLPGIFELFSQAGHLEGTAAGGLGIGLTVVRSMVEMHGGSVTASSGGVGLGSEFVVSLPLLKDVAAAHASRRHAAGPGLGRRTYRIVLIDDNSDANMSLEMLLEAVGHAVVTAANGASGLEAVRAAQPQIVVCDIGLPDMTGYAVAAGIREQMRDAMPLMIALTWYGQESDRDRAHAAGFEHHLVKPVDPQALLQLIETHENAGSA